MSLQSLDTDLLHSVSSSGPGAHDIPSGGPNGYFSVKHVKTVARTLLPFNCSHDAQEPYGSTARKGTFGRVS